MTVREAICWATQEQGLPATDVQALLQMVLGCDRLHLISEPTRILRASEWHQFHRAAEARRHGTPLAYILGQVPFLHLTFAIRNCALIPRPETEGLVLLTRDLARQVGPQGKLADIGCGSGAIGLALSDLLPGWRAFLTDRSADACALTRENARRLGLRPPRATVRRGDLGRPLLRHKPFDVLVSNPPYIPSDQLQGLSSDDVRYHEPRGALDGGPDGLDFYRRLAGQTPPLLRSGGYLILEIGHDQGTAVRKLLDEGECWDDIRIVPDRAGHDRVAVARRRRDA